MAFVDLRDAETVRRVKVAARRLLASGERPDVQGFAVAYKKIGDAVTKQPALVVLVDRKPIEKSERAPPIALVPAGGVVDAGQFLRDETFGGASLLLDVQAVGALRPQLAPLKLAPTLAWLRQPVRPAFPGTSVAHAALGGAGTFGALLRDAFGNRYLLSNNHVLALETGERDGLTVGGRFGLATPGDAVTQPGAEPPRARQAADAFGVLLDFVPLHYAPSLELNYCDAALARIPDAATVISSVPFLGAGGGWVDVKAVADTIEIDDVVYKVGRTSGPTVGTVTFVDAQLRVPYDAGLVVFDRQCLTTAMSAPGDSGSLVIGSDGSGKGVLLGGSDAASIFSPLLSVLQLFGKRLGFPLTL